MITSVAHLTDAWARSKNIKTFFEPEVSSTNDLGKALASTSPEPILIVTDHQTHGRGRGKNTWLDQGAGTALLASWVFHMNKAPQPIASPLIGLSLFECFFHQWMKLPWSLKAPNDVYLGEKKVAGILLESVNFGNVHRLVIGVGINVKSHPPLETCTSIEAFTSPQMDDQEWIGFLNKWKESLDHYLPQITQTQMNAEVCNRLLFALNRNPNLNEKWAEALPDGSLRTKTKKVFWSEL